MTDPTRPLPPPTDPWEGRAAVNPHTADGTDSMPQVVFVEVRRKRRWPWVLGILGLLSVICCGICVAVVAPVFEEYPSRIGPMPQQVAGLDRNQDALIRAAALEVAHRIRVDEGVDDAFAEVYEDGKARQRRVLTFGATRLIWDPKGDLDRAIRDSGTELSNVDSFDPGPLGGQLRCADGKDEEGADIVICAWVDHGSLGIGLFYGGRSKADGAAFLRELREKIIQRP